MSFLDKTRFFCYIVWSHLRPHLEVFVYEQAREFLTEVRRQLKKCNLPRYAVAFEEPWYMNGWVVERFGVVIRWYGRLCVGDTWSGVFEVFCRDQTWCITLEGDGHGWACIARGILPAAFRYFLVRRSAKGEVPMRDLKEARKVMHELVRAFAIHVQELEAAAKRPKPVIRPRFPSRSGAILRRIVH